MSIKPVARGSMVCLHIHLGGRCSIASRTYEHWSSRPRIPISRFHRVSPPQRLWALGDDPLWQSVKSSKFI